MCPMLFDFLTIREVGTAAVVCREWCAGAKDDELWRAMYERTQVDFSATIGPGRKEEEEGGGGGQLMVVLTALLRTTTFASIL